MGLLLWGKGLEELEVDMAVAAPLNTQAVTTFVRELNNAGVDRPAFEQALARLQSAAELRAADVIAIAQSYALPGRRLTSKKAAIEAISKRFVELVRSRNKNQTAARARPY